jgi:hypothetical protein
MNKPICILQSPIWTRSGYGDWALAIAKSLLRYDKFDLMLAPTPWGACSKRNLEEEIQDSYGRELLNRTLKGPLQRQPEVFIQMTIPNEFSAPAKYNIGMTAGIETTVPRPEWLEGLNRMNLNIVTSKHAYDVFAGAAYNKKDPNGVESRLVLEKPMEVLFWGANTTIFKKTNEKIPTVEESLADIKESFAFLFVGQWTAGNIVADRKAIGFLIKSFLETFRDTQNPPCLIIKSNGAQISVMDRYECVVKIKEVTQIVKNEHPSSILPNVYLLHGELSDIEMNALYNHEKIKVHVSFTHGEGFGHPLLLSTLSGKPLLAPQWSGHLDFLNPAYSRFFEGKLVPLPGEAVNDWFIKESQWFEVNYELAGKKMKHYFENYGNNALADAEKLRLENATKFSLEAMDKIFHAILNKYVPSFATEQTIVLPKLKKLNLPSLKKLNPTEPTNPPTQEEIQKMPVSDFKN